MLLSAWSLQFFLILVTTQQHPELHLKEIPHHSLRHWFCGWVQNWRQVLERLYCQLGSLLVWLCMDIVFVGGGGYKFAGRLWITNHKPFPFRLFLISWLWEQANTKFFKVQQQGRTNSIIFSCWIPDLHKETDFTCSREYSTSGKFSNNSRKY